MKYWTNGWPQNMWILRPKTNEEKQILRSNASQADKDLSIILAKRNANDLAEALRPFLGNWSQLIFGIGVLAMALSTMLVHAMMNGYAISEAFGQPGQQKYFLIGAAIPAISGLLSPIIWSGTVKAALVVPASVIATTSSSHCLSDFFIINKFKKSTRQ